MVEATEAVVEGPDKGAVPELLFITVTKASVALPKKERLLGVCEASVVLPKKESILEGVTEASVVLPKKESALEVVGEASVVYPKKELSPVVSASSGVVDVADGDRLRIGALVGLCAGAMFPGHAGQTTGRYEA